MKVTVRAFTGMRPVVSDDLLKPGESVLATNTYLSGGELVAYNNPLDITTLTSASQIKSIYRYGQSSASETQFWFQTANDANFVKGPIDGDTEERTYMTGVISYPSKTKADIATTATPYPSTMLPMGNGKPASALTATVTGTATNPTTDPVEYVTYIVTFVNAWGEESPPSAASTTVGWQPGQSISITALPTTSVASYPGNANKSQTWTGKRIYRSATGSSGAANFLLVNTGGDIAIATTTYTDSVATSALGEVIQSRYWIEPPDDMLGLTQMANGVLVGYSGSTVCFSEPFVPYAWPIRYQQSVDAPITGIAAFDQSVLIATKRSLYVMTGPDPSSITSQRLAVSQTCMSKRSMVEMMGGVVFACPDGLAMVTSGGFQMLSDGLLARRDWQAYAPTSIHAYESDNRYVCFYDTGTVQKGLVFTFGSEPSFCELDFYATAGFRDRSRDALYLCFDAGGSNRAIRKWDSNSTQLSYSWLSGVYRLGSAVNLGVARVMAAGTVNFELLADGVVKFGPMAIADSMLFKLPSGYRSQRYQIRLTGSASVRSVEVADCTASLLAD